MAKAKAKKVDSNRLVPKALANALADHRANADSETLLRDLIEVWGGPRRLATDIHAEFQAAAKGGMTRQRILEMIQRLIVNNTNRDIGRVAKPSDMTDGDLEQVAIAYMRRLSDGPGPA